MYHKILNFQKILRKTLQRNQYTDKILQYKSSEATTENERTTLRNHTENMNISSISINKKMENNGRRKKIPLLLVT
jgi:hypothetical protein